MHAAQQSTRVLVAVWVGCCCGVGVTVVACGYICGVWPPASCCCGAVPCVLKLGSKAARLQPRGAPLLQLGSCRADVPGVGLGVGPQTVTQHRDVCIHTYGTAFI